MAAAVVGVAVAVVTILPGIRLSLSVLLFYSDAILWCQRIVSDLLAISCFQLLVFL